MPNVTGQVLFNSNNASASTGTGISGVQIALVNSSGNGLIIDTDASGNFSFVSVPAGGYALIEAYGSPSSGLTPGNFDDAAPITTLLPADPPITAVPSPPAQANIVQSLSPNTRTLTVIASNITGQNFVDGPVQDIPITKLDLSLIGNNIITSANNGDWGTLPNATAVNSAPATAPYPGVVPGFSYIAPSTTSPGDGQYTVMNINTLNIFTVWYNTADHTSRDETGRFWLAGSSGILGIFTETIPVTPNTYYVFSGWILNPIRAASGFLPSQLTIKVLGGSGNTIYNQSLLSIEEQDVLPQWNESSTLFNTGNNTVINFQIITAGQSGSGNDYIIDDLVIQEANINTIVTSNKSVDKAFASVGDTLNYTIELKNTGDSTVQNIVFADTIPTGTNFISGTVRVNGTPFTSLNPTPPGFTISSPSTLLTGNTITITFSVLVNTIPTSNPIQNSSLTSYFFQPIAGGATVPQTVLSNIVSTQINQAELRTSKTRDLSFVTLGDIITYTIPISNFGTTVASNVILKDTIPNGTTLVANSVIINGVSFPNTTPNPPGINLGNISPGAITTVEFKVIVTTTPTINPITNSATQTYDFTVDPSIPTIKTEAVNTNIVTSQFNAAILASNKIVNKNFANIGDILTYTIAITNSGNVTATNLVLLDTIPNGTTYITGSLKQDGTPIVGASSLLNVTLPSDIASTKISTVTFQVQVLTIPNPNPIPNTASVTSNYLIDGTTTPNRFGTSNTNTNIVNTQINNANLGNITKYVDKAFATCGQELTYTIVIPNSGNTTALDVVVTDTIPNGSIFVIDSVAVNGTTITGVNPLNGVNIGMVSAGTSSTLTFRVKVSC